MAQRPSGFGKPRLKRAEPREIPPSAAAPEPPTTLREQARVDNSEWKDAWQSARSVSVSRLNDKPRPSLTDAQFDRAAPLLQTGRSRRGRKPRNNRLTLEGILYHIRTGGPWRDLSPYFGKWSTVYRAFNRWCRRGVFLLFLLSMARELDLRVLLVDGTFAKVHQHGTGAPKGDGHPSSRGKRKLSASVAVA